MNNRNETARSDAMDKLTRRLRFKLPAAPASPEGVGSSQGRPLVIVLDDDPTICLMIKLLLEVAAGVRVLEANSNEQALKLAANARVELLVSNLARPGTADGLNFLKSFKISYPRVPVIIVSGCIDPVARSLAFKLGASACVSKLLATSKLLQEVSMVLRENRPRSASSRLARRGSTWVRKIERCVRGRWRQPGQLGQ